MKTVKVNGNVLPLDKVNIEVHYDQFAENPILNDEGFPPTFIYGSRWEIRNKEYTEDVFCSIELPEYDDLALERKNKFHDLINNNEIRLFEEDDTIKDFIIEHIDNHQYKQAHLMLDFFGIKSSIAYQAGTSQGDWSNSLIILNQEFFDVTGADPDKSIEIIDECNKELDQYCNGEVYWYNIVYTSKINITDIHFPTEKQTVEFKKDLDSISGFIGNNPAENGMQEYVPEELWPKLDIAMENVIY